MSGIDILRSYEQQFGSVCAEITANISRTIRSIHRINYTYWNEEVSKIEANFQDANEIIEQMDLEINDNNEKRSLEQKEKYVHILSSFKTELNNLKTEFNNQVKNVNMTNIPLDTEPNEYSSFSELYNIGKQNESVMINMNKSLDKSYKMVLETEEAGNVILEDLYGQRETIQKSRERLRVANDNLGKSSRVVGKMTKHLIQNRFILFGMFLVVIFFLTFIFYVIINRRLS